MRRFRIWHFICDVIELTTALECQKQLLILTISNLGGWESLEIAASCIVNIKLIILCVKYQISSKLVLH